MSNLALLDAPAPPAATGTATIHFLRDAFAGGRITCTCAAGQTVAEAASAHWPESWPDEAIALAVVRNGEAVEITDVIEPGDHIAVYPRVGAEVIGTAVLGVVGITAGATVASIVGGILLMAASTGVSMLLAPDAPSMGTGDNQHTNTYGWDGPTTEYRGDGGVMPVVYGEHIVSGTTISYVVRSRGIRSFLYVLISMGEGKAQALCGSTSELDGAYGNDLVEGGLRVGGVDARQWGRIVRVWTRLGGLDQRPIPGMNDEEKQYPIGLALKKDKGLANPLKTREAVTAVELVLEFPKGLVYVNGDGDTLYNRARFKTHYRVLGTQPWSAWEYFRVKARSTSAFRHAEEIEFPASARYEIDIVRVDDPDQVLGANDPSTLWAITEIIERDFIYPDEPLVGLRIQAVEGLAGGKPQCEILERGRLVPIWGGSAFTNAWSQNPFWIALDMLRNTNYGLGNALRYVAYDFDEWKTAADHADELVYAEVTTTVAKAVAAGATIIDVASTDGFSVGDRVMLDVDAAAEEGPFTIKTVDVEKDQLEFKTAVANAHALASDVDVYHERYQFDFVADGDGSPWELVDRVLSTARARVVKVGNSIRLVRQVTKTPVMLVTEGNVGVDDFVVHYANPRVQPTELLLQFANAERRYQRDALSVEATDAILDDATQSEFYQREGYALQELAVWGISRPAQVRRHGRFKLRALRLPTRSFGFTMPLEAIVAAIGDVVDIAHRVVIDGGWSGRIYEAASSGGATIKIDRAVTLLAATTYAIRVRVGDSVMATRQITSGAGSYARGDSLSISGTWPGDIAKYAPYALGVQGFEVVSAEITAYAHGGDNRIAIAAMEYVEAVHADT